MSKAEVAAAVNAAALKRQAMIDEFDANVDPFDSAPGNKHFWSCIAAKFVWCNCKERAIAFYTSNPHIVPPMGVKKELVEVEEMRVARQREQRQLQTASDVNEACSSASVSRSTVVS
jgi:hypothetical protein